MRMTETGKAHAVSSRVWQDVARLAAEALAVGVVFSMLLALAVFVVARNGHADDLAARAEFVQVAVSQASAR